MANADSFSESPISRILNPYTGYDESIRLAKGLKDAGLGDFAAEKLILWFQEVPYYREKGWGERVIHALAALRSAQATAFFIGIISGKGMPTMKCEAASVLGEIGDPSAIDALIQALDYGRDDLAMARDTRLFSIELASAVPVWNATARALGELRAKSAVTPLLEALDRPELDRSPVERAEAIRVFRSSVIEALGMIADPAATDRLISFLRADSKHRHGAAFALGKIRAARAVQPLLSLLGELESEPEYCVVEALGKIRDPAALDPLIQRLQRRETKRPVPKALEELGDPRAIEPLARLFFATPKPETYDECDLLEATGAAIISIASRHIESLSDEVLRLLLGLKDRGYCRTTWDHDTKCDEVHEICFDSVRTLAASVLGRRGNPTVEPATGLVPVPVTDNSRQPDLQNPPSSLVDPVVTNKWWQFWK